MGSQDGRAMGITHDPPSEDLRTQNAENAINFHMVAEQRHAVPATIPITGRSDDIIDPPSPTSSSLASSTSYPASAHPHELPDNIWTSPSSLQVDIFHPLPIFNWIYLTNSDPIGLRIKILRNIMNKPVRHRLRRHLVRFQHHLGAHHDHRNNWASSSSKIDKFITPGSLAAPASAAGAASPAATTSPTTFG